MERVIPFGSAAHEKKCVFGSMNEIADQVCAKELSHFVGLSLLQGIVQRHQLSSEDIYDFVQEQQ